MRKRISEETRARLHGYLDDAIDKMDSEKNRRKKHWSLLSSSVLGKMAVTESHELELAIMEGDPKRIESECHDIINIGIMEIDNLYSNLSKDGE